MSQSSPSDRTEVKLHETMDASIWADEFNKVLVSRGEQPHDLGWLIGWFANALICGYDHHYESERKRLKGKREARRQFWLNVVTAPFWIPAWTGVFIWISLIIIWERFTGRKP